MTAPIRLFPLTLALCVPACVPVPGDDDSASDDDTAGDDDSDSRALVLTTDYVDTRLVTVDLADLSVTDPVTTLVGGDFVGRRVGDDLYLVGRFGTDSVTRYAGSNLDAAPDLQFSTGAGSNPHDVALCGGKLFVSAYETNEVIVRDAATGGAAGVVDVAEFIDTDDLSEPDTFAASGDRLFLSLQRMERGGDFWIPAADGGRVVEIDCSGLTVVDSWVTGPSPTLHGDGDIVLIRTGTFWAIDGEVQRLDTSTGEANTLVDETTLNADITDVAVAPSGFVVAINDFNTSLSSLHCFDGAGTALGATESMASTFSGLAVGPDGALWAGVRSSWDDPTTPAGVMRIDPETCEEIGAAWISTTMQPSGLVFLP